MFLSFLSSLSVNDGVLLGVLGLALFFDLGGKRIPNFITFPAILWGLISYTVFSGGDGLLFSLGGLLLGAAVFFIPFAMGGMGGGDVKLMGAVGALQGWQFVLSAAILTALFGGVMALVYLVWTRRLWKVFKKMLGAVAAPFLTRLYYLLCLESLNRAAVNLENQRTWETAGNTPSTLPYGAAIAAGTLMLLAWEVAGGEMGLHSLPW